MAAGYADTPYNMAEIVPYVVDVCLTAINNAITP